MFKLNSTLTHLFGLFGYEYYDYSSIKNMGTENCEFIDGFHGSEKAYLRIFIDISYQSDIIDDFTSIPKMKDALKGTDNCYLSFIGSDEEKETVGQEK
jgi:hypothetical protein